MRAVAEIRMSQSEFFLRHLAPAIAAAALLLAWERAGFDSTVSGWFFDPLTRVFPLRNNLLVETIGHRLMKELVVIICCWAIALYLLSFVLSEVRPHRRVLLFLWLAMACAPLTVALLKTVSSRHCPWDLLEYGGFAPHLSLFEAVPPPAAPGRCFPGGHASAGFSLLAFYFVGQALGNRRLALLGLWCGLGAGMLFGLVRIAQGAHFLSHNLWSAVVCWFVTLVVYTLVIRVRDKPDGGHAGTAKLEANKEGTSDGTTELSGESAD
jgi:membrane-associated PAP2 superfamily phosphatase